MKQTDKKKIIKVVVFMALLLCVFLVFNPSQKSGKELFKYYECITCHTFRGEGKKIGPDLTNVGEAKSIEWIREQIINPKLHNPETIMVRTLPLITQKEIDTLVKYLTTRK